MGDRGQQSTSSARAARRPTGSDRLPFTPAFGSARHGYDRAEVDEFVASCRAALEQLEEENRDLRAARLASRELALVYADTARQRHELERLRTEGEVLRVEVEQLRSARDAARRDLEAMAATLRAWLAAHDRSQLQS